MAFTGKAIVTRVKDHIRKRGGSFAKWFVGVSAKPRIRLFRLHQVPKTTGQWILMRAESPAKALQVKRFLSTKLKMVAGRKLSEKTADFVYAYRMTAQTKQ